MTWYMRTNRNLRVLYRFFGKMENFQQTTGTRGEEVFLTVKRKIWVKAQGSAVKNR